jgi:hypothetical protein
MNVRALERAAQKVGDLRICVRRTFPEHESIDHRRNAGFRVTYIDDKRGAFACSKTMAALRVV